MIQLLPSRQEKKKPERMQLKLGEFPGSLFRSGQKNWASALVGNSSMICEIPLETCPRKSKLRIFHATSGEQFLLVRPPFPAVQINDPCLLRVNLTAISSLNISPNTWRIQEAENKTLCSMSPFLCVIAATYCYVTLFSLYCSGGWLSFIAYLPFSPPSPVAGKRVVKQECSSTAPGLGPSLPLSQSSPL